MPYIRQYDRDDIADGCPATTCGALSYVLAKEIDKYVETNGLHYTTLNDVLGALDGLGKEFYRRVVAPYEDAKMAENGEVFSSTAARLAGIN